MFARIVPVMAVVALFGLPAQAETYKQERAAHPRIAKAIHELREAVK